MVCTGSTHDARSSDFFQNLLTRIASARLSSNFTILGLVPREDFLGLLRDCVAVIQPSFYEGWSTSVEEAKAFGKTILLSDIPVHREQSPDHGMYFDPLNPAALGQLMLSALESEKDKSTHYDFNSEKHIHEFENFGLKFVSIVSETLKRSRSKQS